MTAHAAFLRVYEPLAAFEGEERRRWEAATGIDAVSPAAGAELERTASVRAHVGRVSGVSGVGGVSRVGTAGSPLPALGEQAYATEVDGVRLVCPWRTRLRALEALEEFAADLPEQLLRAFALPSPDTTSGELARWRNDHPGLRSHQLMSTWHVPLRWFVLVDADERQFRAGAPAAGGGAPAGRLIGRTLVYRTPMSRARRRVARALAVLRRTVDDGVVTEGVEELGRWLEEFHPRSLVELDYGGLVHLLDDTALAEDESARDVATALAALGEGEAGAATEAYARVTGRMKALQAVESAN